MNKEQLEKRKKLIAELILENEFYKCIGINIDLRWVLSLMVSCRFNILYDNL